MFSYKQDTIKGGVHYMTAFTQDERVAPRDPDGSIKIVGADARISGGIFGDLFVGGSFVKLDHAQHVDGSIQTVHVSGGQAFMDNFLGTDPTPETRQRPRNGLVAQPRSPVRLQLRSAGALPRKFLGRRARPPVHAVRHVSPRSAASIPLWDNVKKLKFGGQVIYSPLSWLQVGTRVDRVIPNMDTDPDVSPTD